MAEHEQLAQRLAIQIYVADPYRPWQRSPNENTNGLLRQYLPNIHPLHLKLETAPSINPDISVRIHWTESPTTEQRDLSLLRLAFSNPNYPLRVAAG